MLFSVAPKYLGGNIFLNTCIHAAVTSAHSAVQRHINEFIQDRIWLERYGLTVKTQGVVSWAPISILGDDQISRETGDGAVCRPKYAFEREIQVNRYYHLY